MCWRSRRYSAITRASPGSLLAPETTSPSRQALIAVGLTGTTGCPACSSASTRRPSGRSIATGTPAGSPRAARRRIRPANPAAECSMMNWHFTCPALSTTQTACDAAAQSIPVKNAAAGTAADKERDNETPQAGSDNPARRLAAGPSLTGALRRVLLLPVCSPARAGGGSVMLALNEQRRRAVTPALTGSEQRASCQCPPRGECTSDGARVRGS